MNRILIPSILVITVLVAGIYAFQPIDQATAVHNTIIDATTASGGFDTLHISNPVDFDADADRLILLDIHEEVSEGFVILRTDGTVNCTFLQIVVTNDVGAIQGNPVAMTQQTGAAEAGSQYARLCHAHVPIDGGVNAVFVAMSPVATQTEIIPAHSTITTTISAINDATVAG